MFISWQRIVHIVKLKQIREIKIKESFKDYEQQQFYFTRRLENEE